MKSLRIVRTVLWVAVAAVAGLLIGVVATAPWQASAPTAPISTGVPRIGGPFELTSHRGETIDNESLSGKPYLAFFGFTHCPDICPTTLFELSDLMKEIGPAADRFNVVFFTVDPERDSQDLLARYMTSFDARIIALRGDEEQTRALLKSFAAYAEKVPLEGGSYTMDHTAGVYLMGAEGRFAGTLDMHEPREIRLRKLRRLAGES